MVQSGLFILAEPGNVAMFWGYTFFYGVAYGAVPPLLRSMMADVTDVDELQTGTKRCLQVFRLVLTTVNKLGGAVAVGVAHLPRETLVFGFVGWRIR